MIFSCIQDRTFSLVLSPILVPFLSTGEYGNVVHLWPDTPSDRNLSQCPVPSKMISLKEWNLWSNSIDTDTGSLVHSLLMLGLELGSYPFTSFRYLGIYTLHRTGLGTVLGDQNL